jgi:ribonuclease III
MATLDRNGSAVAEIEAALGHDFSDPDLLREALTHSSFAAENPGFASYERLEFLGDAVLELVTTTMIFDAMDGEPEGVMTKVRASIVDEATLANVARAWHLGAGLRLGVGEERSGGRGRDSILSDAAEAVIAAVYLDAGFDSVSGVIERVWIDLINDRLDRETVADGRSALQEALAKRGLEVTFAYDRQGPDHASVYTATAIVDGEPIGSGIGGSKKAAAIAAADDALTRGRLNRGGLQE